MWITSPDTFVSIAYQPEWCAPDELVVRARRREDLAAFDVPEFQVIETSEADYPFRANVKRIDIALELSARVMGLDYRNMKAQVTDESRHTAYEVCWGALLDLEETDGYLRLFG